MMTAFTSFTRNSDAVAPPGRGPSPSNLVPDHSNENTEPKNSNDACRTPLSSPVKRSTPATPQPADKSTPLRRRYLEEVAMSPATPPRTPSPHKGRVSPNKKHNSPTKGRDSPTKQKLEVGQNGFYFSCELPMSKITPKKLDADAMTPTRRTPSPTKTGSARKNTMSRGSSPARQTPSKRKSPEKPTVSKALRTSPVKERIPKKAAKEASVVPASSATKNGLPKKSVTASSLSPTPAQDATTIKPPKQAEGVKEAPLKALDRTFMLTQGAVTPSSAPAPAPETAKVVTNEALTNDGNVAPAERLSTKSPRPLLNATGQTPTKAARGASFDIGDLMAGLKSQGSRPRAATTEYVGDTIAAESPNPLQKAAERLKISDVERIWKAHLASPAKNVKVAHPLSPVVDASPVSRIPIPFKIREQTLQYQPVPFPSSKAESVPSPENTASPWKKHVKFQVSDPSGPKPDYPKTPRCTGTDPELLSTMQQEMHTLQTSLSNSLGVNFKLSGKENTFELPATTNPSFESKHEATPKLRHLRMGSDQSNSTTSSMSTVRASMLMTPKHPTASRKVKLPERSGAVWTPAKPRTDMLSSVKENTELKPPKKMTIPTAPNRPLGTTMGPPSIPHNRRPIKRALSTPALRNPDPSAKPTAIPSKLSATPLKPRTSVSASARKSNVVLTPGQAKATCTPKVRPSTIRPTANASKTPQFASATDIADRIAQWNSQDRVRRTTKPPSSTHTTPSKPPPTKVTKPAKPETKQSYTPPGSPPKTPIPNSLVPKRAAPKTPTTPDFGSPVTPKVVNPALARLKGIGAPRTSARMERDPGATRTPSKEIEMSLGSAIDRKILEDRMGM
jgi:hypothetical protein